MTAEPGPLLTHRFHVTMGDIDSLGILFYATPLLWAERVLSDWRRRHWMSLTDMLASGLATPVVRTEISYVGPLGLDDEVEATIWPVTRSQRSFTVLVRFAAATDARVAVEVQIKQVCVHLTDGRMSPAQVPDSLAVALDAGLGH